MTTVQEIFLKTANYSVLEVYKFGEVPFCLNVCDVMFESCDSMAESFVIKKTLGIKFNWVRLTPNSRM